MKEKITTKEQLRRAAQESVTLIEQVADAATQAITGLAERTAAALDELTAAKQDKLAAVPVTIPTSGWVSDSTSGYPYYYDITAEWYDWVSARDRATVVIAPASMSIAVACGLCPVCETLANKIRIRATSIPTAGLSAVYWIEKGTG